MGEKEETQGADDQPLSPAGEPGEASPTPDAPTPFPPFETEIIQKGLDKKGERRDE